MKLCSEYHKGLYTWTQALRTLFVYTEFTKKKVSEQLTSAVLFPFAAVLPVENLRMRRNMEES